MRADAPALTYNKEGVVVMNDRDRPERESTRSADIPAECFRGNHKGMSS